MNVHVCDTVGDEGIEIN